MGLLRNRSFLLVFVGLAISLLGDALYGLVIPLWVLHVTGSAKAMAAVAGISAVMNLLVAPLAGTFADRSDRRRIMVGTDIVRGAIVLALAAVLQRSLVQVAPIAVAAVLLTVAGAFFSPAYAAAQSGLVHPQDLTRALSLFQVMRQSVAFVGPSLAGIVVARLGSAGALGLDALSFLVSAVCVAAVRLEWGVGAPQARRPFWHDFRTGFATVMDSQVIRRTVLLSCGVNFAGAMFGVLLPVIAVREWRLSPSQYGLFNTLSPAGMMLGLLLIGLFSGRLKARGPFMLQALLAMGLLNMLMGVASAFIPFILLLFLSGLAFGLANSMFAAIYRVLVPQERQGRFFGLIGALGQALMPLGFGAAGFLADVLSPFHVAAGAGGIVTVLAVIGLMTPGLRDVQ